MFDYKHINISVNSETDQHDRLVAGGGPGEGDQVLLLLQHVQLLEQRSAGAGLCSQ